MCHAEELKFYPKKDEKHSESFLEWNGSEVAICTAVSGMDWKGLDLRQGDWLVLRWSSRGDVTRK